MRAFLAGFAAAAVLLTVATQPLPKPPASEPTTRSFFSVEAPIANVEATAAPDPVNLCRPALGDLLERYSIRFDHLSPQIKADALFLVDAITAALAPCPSAVLIIDTQISAQASSRARELAERRAASLASALASRGVLSRVETRTVTNAKTTLALELASESAE